MNVIPCTEAHPTKTCTEYEEWIDLIEAEAAHDDGMSGFDSDLREAVGKSMAKRANWPYKPKEH